jgi:hypothetical protein
MIVCYPPNYPVATVSERPTIFLAGSIEMDKAVDWQKEFISHFVHTDAVIFNPRRKDWDNTISQTIDDPQFKAQVDWELTMLDQADIIAMYLQPGTISPISLLELGLFRCKQIVVCCPDGFHRKGNVDIVCARYYIDMVDTLDDLIQEVKERIK